MSHLKSKNKSASFLASQSGATLIVVALAFMLLLICLGVVIDVARVAAVQTKAQNAADASLLGMVATVDVKKEGGADETTKEDMISELTALYNANYPASYMGSNVGDIDVNLTVNGSKRIFETDFDVFVPTVIMNIFGQTGTNIHITSQVTHGFDEEKQNRLELALVLDNTGSMNDVIKGVKKIDGLKQASKLLLGILFGDAATLKNINITIIPYDLAVHVGPGHNDWVQAAWQARYLSKDGFLSNRDNDIGVLYPTRRYEDVTDDPPSAADSSLFRTPSGAVSPYVTSGCIPSEDKEYTVLPRMRFAMNVKADTLAMVDTMVASGCTRINVGLMWGWFSLSPKWQGKWDAARPALPANPDPLLSKVIVLMTDGVNTVYKGANTTSNDDTKTRSLCTAAKAQGITIYTVGFGDGGNINETLLRECATRTTYYFRAPTADDLKRVFTQIGDDILFDTLSLTH